MNATSLAKLRKRITQLPKRSRGLLLATIYAVGGALVAVLFQVMTNYLYRHGLVALSHQARITFLLGSFALTVGSALAAGVLVHRLAPEAAGSGIPQLKRAFWQDFGFIAPRTLWIKFISAGLQIGGGSSLGREGPSVQLAGAAAANLAVAAGNAKQKLRRGAATGAAAGLAAAFNTPLAAVTFVLEEIIGDLNSRLLGGVLLAAVAGALVTHAVFGPRPAFVIAPSGEPTWRAYLLVPIVGIAAALIGSIFQVSALRWRGRCKSSRAIPQWLLPSLGAVVCWAVGAAVFIDTGRLGVFGLGYDDLSSALAGNLPWEIAVLLLFAKLLATIACYAAGGSGGIFAPTLFVGGMTGLAIAGLAQLIMPLHPDGVAMLAIIGMSATLGAVVRAPVTSILIVFEMTHEFALVPPLMLAALISQPISRRLLKHNFYDALLEQDGHNTNRFMPPADLRGWQEQPVSAFAQSKPVVLESTHPDAISVLIRRHPYERFPYVHNGQVMGVVTRAEAELAVREKREPQLKQAVTCTPDESLRAVEGRLVESTAGLVVVQSRGTVVGLLTLHDLLRAQMAAAEQHDALGD